jgi:RNA recognition motif-containing protein
LLEKINEGLRQDNHELRQELNPQRQQSNEVQNILLVFNLDPNVNETILYEKFKSYGLITHLPEVIVYLK